MCGQYGFSHTTEFTKRMSPVLALCMQDRGRDSWGVTDGNAFYKHLGTISSSFDAAEPLGQDGLFGLSYHTRGASVGGVSTPNSHPFEWLAPNRRDAEHPEGYRVMLMHNGHISNHWELKRKYWDQRKDIQVDSHHLAAHLAEGLPLEEIDGWAGSVVWWEMPIGAPEERVRYISTFGHPALSVVQLESGEIVYASTDTAIATAARLAGAKIAVNYKIEVDHKYTFDDREVAGQFELYDLGRLPWCERPLEEEKPKWTAAEHGRQSTIFGCSSGRKKNKEGRRENFCLYMGCYNTLPHRDQVLCSSCISVLRMREQSGASAL